ncbi:acetyl-CoA synthetase [Arthrobacter sp. V4I6]|uniref:acyl-CoA synthetase n=1 Tax=unclassified Arthrobacter TaxID=235627 RepID=UPI002782CB97|nr:MULTISPECIES: AMP-binding protein [unclassified Arthrobacter]MDQ0822984.1 acetyl-CoA synthetase [Arthrobacter sp. V1I7]MDQ0852612.1 acetyl-CoA synthetase [Arthrobacter sp. V4I6]
MITTPSLVEDHYAKMLASHNWEVPEVYNMAVDVADRHPRHKRALILESTIEGRRDVNWGEIQDRSRQIAATLQDAGIKKGDRVAVLLPQRADTPAVYLGVLRTGAILVTMSLLWAPEPIRFRLGDSGATVIIAEEASKDLFAGYTGAFIDVDSPAIAERPAVFQDVPTKADDPALIFYTSGTTGRAKGIVHAHRTLLGHNEFDYCHALGDGDVFYGAGDWAWSLAKLMGPLRAGATHLVFRPAGGFDPAALLDSLQRNKVTSALVNPTFLRKMREDVPDAGTRFPLSLRTVCSSNEPLTPDLIDWFRVQFGTTLLDYYGSTESYPLLGNFPDVPVKSGSMGRPLPGWEVRLLDEGENEVPVGATGEICLRARSNPQYPLGYWNMPEASVAAFGGNWYHTKDQAYADDDGYFWFLGRIDDVIKTSGYRVGPYELEAVIRELDPVKDVSVTGVPDELRGQSIKAWVELMPGHSGDAQLNKSIVAHVKENFSRFAYPRYIEYVTALPKSATGKVQRAELRALPDPAPSDRNEGLAS